MTVGFTAFVLIAYNGIIDPPGSGNQEIGITKEIGYYVALLSSLGIAVAGIGRAMEVDQGRAAQGARNGLSADRRDGSDLAGQPPGHASPTATSPSSSSG